MILRPAIVFAAALWGLAGAALADTRFLATFDDVPLAPGFEEEAAAAFSFAAPEGRIAETWAAGRAQGGEAETYYRAALPALGWSLDTDRGDLVFVRGRERLTLTFARGSDGASTVRFRLVVRPASLALD